LDSLELSNNEDLPSAVNVARRVFIVAIGSSLIGWSRVYAFNNKDAALKTMDWYIGFSGWDDMQEDRSHGNVKGFTDPKSGDWVAVSSVLVSTHAVLSATGRIRA